MSGIYTVLARKWRPLTFDDVVGQDVVVRTLRNAIDRDRVAHAYLFAGSRGTGKTTVARILARALNCADGPTATPCGECDTCRDILSGTSLDVLEIDGASTRGIDDVRRLREDVKLAPSKGRKKVYIVDEVHMLTHQAFNALLKTLEEPPAHVVFVLATTDPQKLPDTILSRCQRYNFTRISVPDTVARLKHVVESEGVALDDAALLVLARRSGGALRDALGFLDQVMATGEVESAGKTPIGESAVVDALGLVGSDVYTGLLRAFVEHDAAAALAIVSEAHRSGHDVEFFVQGLVDVLRDVLVIKSTPATGGDSAPSLGDILDRSPDDCRELTELTGPLGLGDVLRLIRIALETSDQLRSSDYPWVHLEVSIVEMASLDRVADLSELIGAIGSDPPGGGGGAQARPPRERTTTRDARARGGTRSPGKGTSSGASAGMSASADAVGLVEVLSAASEAPPPATSAAPTSFEDGTPLPPELWRSVLDRVKSEKPLLWSVLTQGEPGPVRGGALTFQVDPDNGFHVEQLREPAHLDLIRGCLSAACETDLGFRIALADGAGKHAHLPEERRKVLADPFVQKVLEFLDGEVVD